VLAKLRSGIRRAGVRVVLGVPVLRVTHHHRSVKYVSLCPVPYSLNIVTGDEWPPTKAGPL
jgi:hypothetical protein